MSTFFARSTKAERFAWCLYDFANSAFPTVIVTTVYVLYFKGVVVGGEEPGRSDKLWGAANSIAAAIVFLTAPILGAAADIAGKKRALLMIFAFICIVATACLSLTSAGTVFSAMALVIAAVAGFEGSVVFYNAFLPELAEPEEMGRLSGKGWALGYAGGLCCMLLILPFASDHIRMVPLAVSAWYLFFSIPAFALLKDRTTARPGTSFLKEGLLQLTATLKKIKEHDRLVRFLVAFFFYNNAVVTIIVFAVAFSSDSLAFTTRENILLVTVMNAVAAPGALFFGWVADRIGARTTLIVTLVMWLWVIAGCEAAVWPGWFSIQEAKIVFWAVAALASLCLGAVQATSRAFVGQMAPPGQSGEFYGFMAFAGKGSAILGPIVFGLASDIFDSQRLAVATIGLFFAVGLALLLRVPSRVNG